MSETPYKFYHEIIEYLQQEFTIYNIDQIYEYLCRIFLIICAIVNVFDRIYIDSKKRNSRFFHDQNIEKNGRRIKRDTADYKS